MRAKERKERGGSGDMVDEGKKRTEGEAEEKGRGDEGRWSLEVEQQGKRKRGGVAPPPKCRLAPKERLDPQEGFSTS